jgi:hypothetical protein
MADTAFSTMENFSRSAFPGAPVRAEELQNIVDCVRQGHCCAIVGPSNTGKSFLLNSLPTDEVRRACTREGLQPPVMVFVDCLEAGGTEQAFYELLFRRTIEELALVGASAAIVKQLTELHREILRSEVDVAIRSLYASGLRQLGLSEDLSLVLILDEFDDLFRNLPPWPFRQLRALYDALQAKLLYITGTSYLLEELRGGTDTYEFRELFHLHTNILRPLTAEDSKRFVSYLSEKQGVAISDENSSWLIDMSGGHPGLLARVFSLQSAGKDELTGPLPVAEADLNLERPIQKECWRLWSELEYEQAGLRTLVEQGAEALSPEQRQALELKGMVAPGDGDGVVIFSPIFGAFVEQELSAQSQAVVKGLRCDFNTGQIWVDDHEVTLQLSEPQRKLVTFLYQKAGTVCSYDDIAVGVWGIGEGVSPGAIYELVKRVRQKVEPDWKNPRYIVTVPGKGYRLETGD